MRNGFFSAARKAFAITRRQFTIRHIVGLLNANSPVRDRVIGVDAIEDVIDCLRNRPQAVPSLARSEASRGRGGPIAVVRDFPKGFA